MKSKMFKHSLFVAMIAITIFAWNALADNEPVSAFSGEATLNTITFTRAMDELNQDADTRTYMEAFSEENKLDTRKIVNSMILIR